MNPAALESVREPQDRQYAQLRIRIGDDAPEVQIIAGNILTIQDIQDIQVHIHITLIQECIPADPQVKTAKGGEAAGCNSA